jgi:predicted patatin/cPLA2 family phospholipase
MTQKPVTILFDDYVDRTRYHHVEQFVRPGRMVGRMAVFEAGPTTVHPIDLLTIASTFSTMEIERKPISAWLGWAGLSRFSI